MMTKTKTIKMLLYDGSLNGVTNISDSAWESGKMYSAPRESIGNLITRADCKKYGVYLLLSDHQVYVGQAVDLERRTKQHLTDKDWWTQVVLMTTKDDSFNASDIDYLEARLINLANIYAKYQERSEEIGKKLMSFDRQSWSSISMKRFSFWSLLGSEFSKRKRRKLVKQ